MAEAECVRTSTTSGVSPGPRAFVLDIGNMVSASAVDTQVWLPNHKESGYDSIEMATNKAQEHESEIPIQETSVAYLTPVNALDHASDLFGIAADDLAVAVGANSRTLGRWRRHDHYPQRRVRTKMRELLQLELHLQQTFEPSGIRIWLNEPSHYFGGVAPADIIRLGRFDRVEAALIALDSGVFI